MHYWAEGPNYISLGQRPRYTVSDFMQAEGLLYRNILTEFWVYLLED